MYTGVKATDAVKDDSFGGAGDRFFWESVGHLLICGTEPGEYARMRAERYVQWLHGDRNLKVDFGKPRSKP